MGEEAVTLTLQEVINVIGDIGILGLLAVIVWSFYRGDVLSRKVYQELTESILERVCSRLITEIREIVKDTVIEVIEKIGTGGGR